MGLWDQFLGMVIVEGCCLKYVLTQTHTSGLNPGGECKFAELPEDMAKEFPFKWRGRLLGQVEAQEAAEWGVFGGH